MPLVRLAEILFSAAAVLQILSTQIHKKDMDKKNTERIIAQIQHKPLLQGIFSINILRMIKKHRYQNRI